MNNRDHDQKYYLSYEDGETHFWVNDDVKSQLSFPIGGIVAFPVGANPSRNSDNWLECNGQSFDTSKYPELYKILGSNKVPNYQGMFLRGYGRSETHTIKNAKGTRYSLTTSSGELGKIQPMNQIVWGASTPALFFSWANDWSFTNIKDKMNVDFDIYLQDPKVGDYTPTQLVNYYNFPSSAITEGFYGVYPFTLGSEHFIPTHPKHYKYVPEKRTETVCSGGENPDCTSIEYVADIREERVDFDADEGGYHPESGYGHLYIGTEYNSPTDGTYDLRPSNVAVKYWIRSR